MRMERRDTMNVTIEEAVERLKASGVRMTAQRELILDYLYARLSHPSAEELFEAIYADYPRVVSITTIYKNMRVLRDLGLLKEFYVRQTGIARYDTNVLPHHHLYCVRCGRVTDYTGALSLPSIEVSPGFQAHSIFLEVTGTCKACAVLQRPERGIAI